ncbi:transcription termination/antitermination protein NusG [Enterovibrio coralii]|uniref:transcription termination/antitermination protein NusG n=1 Tax=Enterovibrio coralii TaxID=294935 RepID=UPI001E422D54|nr:transcription termination/antitermination NusG family protein [Enterovibrio coralii]
MGYEAYLPQRTVRKTVDGKKKVSYEPLFKSHVFVRTKPDGLVAIKALPQFSHFVRFKNYLASIPETHIVKIKTILYYFEESTSIATSLANGVTVAVVNGSLKGMTGILLDDEDNRKVAMEIGQLGRCVLVDVPKASVVRTEFATTA